MTCTFPKFGHNPVTGEWNDSLKGDYCWSSVNYREAAPDVMTPITWSLIWIYINVTDPNRFPGEHPAGGNIIAASGLGEGLFMPALNTSFLDIAPEEHRAQVIGFKESMFSLGGLAGPALVVVAVQYLQPLSIFGIAGTLILCSACLVSLLSLHVHSGQVPENLLGK